MTDLETARIILLVGLVVIAFHTIQLVLEAHRQARKEWELDDQHEMDLLFWEYELLPADDDWYPEDNP